MVSNLSCCAKMFWLLLEVWVERKCWYISSLQREDRVFGSNVRSWSLECSNDHFFICTTTENLLICLQTSCSASGPSCWQCVICKISSNTLIHSCAPQVWKSFLWLETSLTESEFKGGFLDPGSNTVLICAEILVFVMLCKLIHT